jgi:hypothetical protein
MRTGSRLAHQAASLALLAGLATVVSANGGCSSVSRLTTKSVGSGQVYATTFTQAYVTRSEFGQYDVVLVSEPASEKSRPAGEPLQQASAPPLRHIVHLRALWQPWTAPRSDNPALTNSAVHWYVISERASGPPDVLRYDGAGFVRVWGTSGEAQVRVQNVLIEPSTRQGNLSDPIGAALVSGKFRAVFSPRRVREVLGEIEQSAPGGTVPSTAPGAGSAVPG